jgi:hypothetical protein
LVRPRFPRDGIRGLTAAFRRQRSLEALEQQASLRIRAVRLTPQALDALEVVTTLKEARLVPTRLTMGAGEIFVVVVHDECSLRKVVSVFAGWVSTSGLGGFALAGAATRPFARHDHSGDEELATPHAPRLPTLERAGEAQFAHRAVQAEGLGSLDISGRLSEEQLWVVQPAGQRPLVNRGVKLTGEHVEVVECHVTSS